MTIDITKAVQYCNDSAEYDLETAKSLIETGRFPHALFFDHLALEKLLKAIVVRSTRKHAPYTHSLPLLAQKTRLEIPKALMDKLAEYTEFSIEARYPGERRDFYQKCNEEFAKRKFAEIQEVYKWLRGKL